MLLRRCQPYVCDQGQGNDTGFFLIWQTVWVRSKCYWVLTGWLCEIHTVGGHRPRVMSWYIHSLLTEETCFPPLMSNWVKDCGFFTLDLGQMLVTLTDPGRTDRKLSRGESWRRIPGRYRGHHNKCDSGLSLRNGVRWLAAAVIVALLARQNDNQRSKVCLPATESYIYLFLPLVPLTSSYALCLKRKALRARRLPWL